MVIKTIPLPKSDMVFCIYGRRMLSAPPTRCKLPVTKTCIPPFWAPIVLASFIAPSIVGSVETDAWESSLFHNEEYMAQKSGKGVSGALRVLSVRKIISPMIHSK